MAVRKVTVLFEDGDDGMGMIAASVAGDGGTGNGFVGDLAASCALIACLAAFVDFSMIFWR